jgi:glycosyltransferase involved in cell wall biosynthesis
VIGAAIATAPLLSIVIPTRERADTLASAIATALDQRSDRFEVIVCDNCSRDGTRRLVAGIADRRLRYVNPGARVSMSDNWEFALRHSDARYVLFIGDDDAVMPGAIDRLEPLLAESASPIFTWPRTTYLWPTAERGARTVAVPVPAPRAGIDLRALAQSVVRRGGYGFQRPPSVYHGVFHRDVLDAIAARAGRVFVTSQPDVFVAFAAPGVTPRALSLDFIVSVLGHAEKSNGGGVAAGPDTARQRWQQLIDEHGATALHASLFPGVPERVNLIWDTLLVAMDMFPEGYGTARFGYSEMWAYNYRLRDYLGWDTSWMGIVRRRREIRQYQPFSLARFVAASAFHESAVRSRRLRHGAQAEWTASDAATIADYVRSLAC